jgi:[ribosomal protein S5]-alanine N-acetyltransferase
MIILQTERLIIRNFTPGDWRSLHELICQYQSSEGAAYDYPWPTAPEEIRRTTEWFATGDSYLAVCLRETGQLIGFVSLSPEQGEADSAYSLGYVFDSDHHGKGYATEACRAVIGHAFGAPEVDRVASGTAAANHPSRRLLERLGFRQTGEGMVSFRNGQDGKPIEFLGYTYALSRQDWETSIAGRNQRGG